MSLSTTRTEADPASTAVAPATASLAGLTGFLRVRLLAALVLIAASLFAGWLASLPLQHARTIVFDRLQSVVTIRAQAVDAAVALSTLATNEDGARTVARPALALATERLRSTVATPEAMGTEDADMAPLAARVNELLPDLDRLVSESVDPLPPDARDRALALARGIGEDLLPLAAEAEAILQDRLDRAESRASTAMPIILAGQLLILTAIALLCFRPSLTRAQRAGREAEETLDRLKRDLTAVAENNGRLTAIFDVAVAGILTTDSSGIMQMVNPLAARMFGYHPDEMRGRSVTMLLPDAEQEGHAARISEFAETGKAGILGRPREVRGRRRSGELFPVYIAVDILQRPDGPLFVGVMLDITQQKQIERRLVDRETKLNQAESIARLGHFELESDTGRMLASDTVYRILGLDGDGPLTEDAFRLMLHADDRDRWRSLMSDGSWQNRVIEVRLAMDPAGGSGRELMITLQRNRDGGRSGRTIFGILQDVSDLRAMERELRALSTVDPMCQVANRRHLGILADQEMERARRYRRSLAVVLVAIDEFPRVNLTHGHRVGDTVLQAIAETLKAGLRAVDHVGRVGGSKFCIILPETEEPGARVVAERLRLAIGMTTVRGEMSRFQVTASMAVVWRREGDDDFHTLLSRGELLLAEAQSRGGDRVLEEDRSDL